MHIASGHLREWEVSAASRWKPPHAKIKQSWWAADWILCMPGQLVCMESHYLPSLHLSPSRPFYTPNHSSRPSLFTRTLHNDRISARSHVSLHRPRWNPLRPYYTSNWHKKPSTKKKPKRTPELAAALSSSRLLIWPASQRPSVEIDIWLTQTLPLNSTCIVARDALGRWVLHRTAILWHLLIYTTWDVFSLALVPYGVVVMILETFVPYRR